jgi:hypothetical protein
MLGLQIRALPLADDRHAVVLVRTDADDRAADAEFDAEAAFRFAIPLQLHDPFELNGDGVFDHEDKIQAVRDFAAGDRSAESMDEILTAEN